MMSLRESQGLRFHVVLFSGPSDAMFGVHLCKQIITERKADGS